MFPGFLASRRRKWAKNGGKWVKKWVKNGIITGLQKTVLMHASAHLAPAGDPPSWQEMGSLPRARRGFAICGMGPGRLAVVGGERSAPVGPGLGPNLGPSRIACETVDLLDLVTGAWEKAPDLQRARTNTRVAFCGGKLLAVGGSLAPGVAQIAGEHVSECEALR